LALTHVPDAGSIPAASIFRLSRADQRSASDRGAQQLQRKLVWFFSGWLEDDLDTFDPPMG
jgi:hypothetical protein